jgi:amicyanin
MRRLTLLRAPALLLGALLLAGGATVLPAPAARAAGAHQVVMSGYAFSPRALTITAGDTVTWVNEDQAPHDVKTTSGPESVHSPMLNKGGTWSHTFTVPGTYGYVCTVHPGMTAELVVRPAAAPAPSARPTPHQHTGPAPAATSPTRAAPAASTAHDHASGQAAAPANSPSPAASTPAGTAGAAAPAVAAQADASAARPLDPLLLLAGVVAGVAVLCLLLVGSRSAAAARDGGTDPH